MKKQVILFLMPALIFLMPIHAQTISRQQLDSLVALQHQSHEPGGVIAIIKGNNTLIQEAYGMANIENGKTNNTETLFDIASVAKQFTAFAILQLEQEGLLSLDDDIRNHLPFLPDYEQSISIRNLLQHTSGIPSTDVLRMVAGISFDEEWTFEDEMQLIKQYPYLNFAPNTAHVYSNAGYSLLAAMVEEISGLTFPEYLNQKVFTPSGMQSSFILQKTNKNASNLPTGYLKEGEECIVFSTMNDFCYGGGNILTNLHDMTMWAKSIINEGLPGDYFERISNKYNTMESGDSLHYTYGFYVTSYKGTKLVSHSGGVPGFRNQFMILPEHDLALILMFNNESINTRALANGIIETLLHEHLKEFPTKEREIVEVKPQILKAYTGSYLMSDGMELTFEVREDNLWLKLPGGHEFQVYAESDNSFFLKAFDAQCRFELSADQNEYSLIWTQSGGDHRAEIVKERIVMPKEDYKLFAGTFIQTNLSTEYPIIYEAESLTLHLPETFSKYLGFGQVELSHIKKDLFTAGMLGGIEFTRDDKQQIDGFVLLDLGRLQNVKFTKDN